MRGGTAESRVVPLRKKSDIREGRAQKGVGFTPGGITRIRITKEGEDERWGNQTGKSQD